MTRPLVLRSLEDGEGLRCIDIVRAPDGRLGLFEYRRDPEDATGWRATGWQVDVGDVPAGTAERTARRLVPWLADGERREDT